jgi:CheY-like chemotaxis protein
LLTTLGWQVDTLDRGEGALLHLANHRYDLVLLDISMPGMNGFEVCQHIRTDPTLRDLRVIAYTAHAYPEQQQGFLDGGFDGVLVKPLRAQALQALLMAQAPCR